MMMIKMEVEVLCPLYIKEPDELFIFHYFYSSLHHYRCKFDSIRMKRIFHNPYYPLIEFIFFVVVGTIAGMNGLLDCNQIYITISNATIKNFKGTKNR